MAKNSGSTRSGGGETSYQKGGNFTSWAAASIHERGMRDDLGDFGEKNGYAHALGGGISMTLGNGNNVREYTISVDEIQYEGGRRDVMYRTQVTSMLIGDLNDNKEYYDMQSEADKYFNTIEEADRHIKRVVNKMNKYKIK